MRVWKLNDRDFVAAASEEDAASWYVEQVANVDTIAECSPETVMKMQVNEIESRLVTFEERVQLMIDRGERFPAFPAFDTDHGRADKVTLHTIVKARAK